MRKLARKPETSVAMPEILNEEVFKFLIKPDGGEDLLFALWTPSSGAQRLTALVHTPIYPAKGDRQRHGNVSFNPQYFERVCEMALKEKGGVAFLHSHIGPGWQDMSEDDIVAEQRMAGPVLALTEFPLLGMTSGTDGTWSARMWFYIRGRQFERAWCRSVRSVGQRLRVDIADHLVPRPEFHEYFRRTVTVWGEKNHETLARLRVGIVGLGSVGSIIAESLARMGLQYFVLIDFDVIRPHNLDRQLGATKADIGRRKIAVVERQIRRSATAATIEVRGIPYSVVEKKGYRAALDCDVLFSCVDRPRPRKILNHFAYAHLIPVVDGGIQVRFKNGKFSGVDWQLQTAAPGRPCLECLKAFDAGDAETEAEGKLDDPSYMKGLPQGHRLKRNENVFPFSANLASLEVLQFVALVTGIAGIHDFGVQRYRYNPGLMDANIEVRCCSGCGTVQLTAQGDRHFSLIGRDQGAEATRPQTERRTR